MITTKIKSSGVSVSDTVEVTSDKTSSLLAKDIETDSTAQLSRLIIHNSTSEYKKQFEKAINKRMEQYYETIAEILKELAKQEEENRKAWSVRFQQQRLNLKEETENKEQRELNIAALDGKSRKFKCKTMGYYFPDDVNSSASVDIISLM